MIDRLGDARGVEHSPFTEAHRVLTLVSDLTDHKRAREGELTAG
jgi:hypothetical protein